MEALKHRFNAGRESNLFFYRDSNKNEIVLLMLTGRYADGYEIKSASTYHADFAAKLVKMKDFVKCEAGRRAAIYNGTFEDEQSEVQLFNWKHFMPWFAKSNDVRNNTEESNEQDSHHHRTARARRKEPKVE